MMQSSLSRWVIVLIAALFVALMILYQNSVYKSYFNEATKATNDMMSTLKASIRLDSHNPELTLSPIEIGSGPLSPLRQKVRGSGLSNMNLDELSDEDLLILSHSYPDNEQVVCNRRIRMGGIGDGGWEVCDDSDVRPQKPCIIYSFGINYDFTFDDDAAAVYECQVYSFDPSLTRLADQFNRSERVSFHKIGLDERTYTNARNWSMFSYTDIRKRLGHAKEDICLVKMDIEGAERVAIPDMLERGELDSVRQLLMEYHVGSRNRQGTLVNLKLMQGIEKAGFKKFYSHKNPACRRKIPGYPVMRTDCYEVHYLRR